MPEQNKSIAKMKKGRVWIVARFLEANTGKILWVKLSVLLITALAIALSSFLMRSQVLAKDLSNQTDFIHITAPLFNSGVAWSGLANADPSLIIFLQFFPVLIGLLIIVWLKRWWAVFPVALFVFGGACNFTDRFLTDSYNGVSYSNTVVDYLQFEGRSEVFNLPDAFIIIGAGLAVLALLLSTFIGLFKRTPSPTQTESQTAVNPQAGGN